MSGCMGPKAPKMEGPGENETAVTDQLMSMFQSGGTTGFSGQTGNLLNKFIGAAQGSPWGQNIFKKGKAFAHGQLAGIPSEKEFFSPVKQQIDSAYAGAKDKMFNNAATRNVLGSGNIANAARDLTSGYGRDLGAARLGARESRQSEIDQRFGRVTGMGNMLGSMFGQNVNAAGSAYQASAGHDMGNAQMEQIPMQQGLALLSALSGGRQQDFQQLMQQFQAQNQSAGNIFGPLGSIAGLGLMPGGFLL